MVKFICISGKAGSGKDTLAGFMQRNLQIRGKKVLITHYADLLKFICKNFFGWDGKKDEQGRSLLQHVGTDIVREQDPDFWVDFIAVVARFFPDEYDYIIIPDTRFPNEIERLSDAGFRVTHIRVNRPELHSLLTRAQRQHPSETALDGVDPDYVVENPGDMGGLIKCAADACNYIIEEEVKEQIC